MKYMQLGRSGLSVSQIGLGIMRLKDMTQDDGRRLIDTALECGINFFDNAEVYRTEENFAMAAGLTPENREKFIIQSKVGYDRMPSGGQIYIDNSKDRILQSTDGILRRLGIEYLDVLLLHRPDTLMEPDEINEAFERLRNSGKVRHFGVSNFAPATISYLQASLNTKLVCNQLQFGLMNSLMLDSYFNTNRNNEWGVDYDNGMLDYCRLHGITIQAWGPYNHGWFGGPFIDNPDFPKVNETLARFAARKGEGVSNTAMYTAWLCRLSAKMQILAGTTNPQRLRDICRGADIPCSKGEWYDIYLSSGKTIK